MVEEVEVEAGFDDEIGLFLCFLVNDIDVEVWENGRLILAFRLRLELKVDVDEVPFDDFEVEGFLHFLDYLVGFACFEQAFNGDGGFVFEFCVHPLWKVFLLDVEVGFEFFFLMMDFLFNRNHDLVDREDALDHLQEVVLKQSQLVLETGALDAFNQGVKALQHVLEVLWVFVR